MPDNPEELKKIILRLQRDKQRYEQEIDLLHERVRLLYAQLFGKKSEKEGAASQPLPLFDMPEPEEMPEEETVEVPAHTRQKSGRKKLPEELPRIDVVHDIAEEEKVCECGEHLSKIGEEIAEKLDIIPAVIQVVRNIRPKYACKQCEGLETTGALHEHQKQIGVLRANLGLSSYSGNLANEPRFQKVLPRRPRLHDAH